MNKHGRTPRGFTLIEMVMVIVITGIIAGMVAVFIRAPVQGYFDLESRVALTDAADTALRRIGRDLRIALPNSILVPAASNRVGFIPTITGGRYRAEGVGALDFISAPATAFAFEVIGPMPVAPQPNDHLVIYNLGITGANAYDGSNRVQISGVTGNMIALPGGTLFPFESPAKRFHVVPNTEKVVYYVCAGAGKNNGNGTGILCRHTNLAFNASAPTTCPAGASVLAENVSACTFRYDQMVNQRNGLVTMQLSLTRNNETVNLYHEVHVSNVP